MGDTTPNMPAPPADEGGGCGILGKIIMIVVAVAVTAVTGGAGGAVSSFWGGLLGQGSAAAAVATGATAAAAGSVASQAVGVAIGAQSKFSWKNVALAAVSGGVSGGLGTVDFTGSGELGSLGNTVIRSALGNTLSQGIGVATGLQKSFDWKSVAGAAVGAGVGWGVGQALGSNANTLAGAGIRSFAAGTATALVRGGKISITQVAVDAFGSALGDGLGDTLRAGRGQSQSQENSPQFMGGSAGGGGNGSYQPDNGPDWGGMGTGTGRWTAEPAGPPALTALTGGDFARMDRASEEVWAAHGGAWEQQEDRLGAFIEQQEAARSQLDRSYSLYGLGGKGAHLDSVGGNPALTIRTWSNDVDVGVINAASSQRDSDLAMLRTDVERQVQFVILGEQARDDSLNGAQLLPTGGSARGGGPRGIGSGGFEMVRNGNWDAALNIGSDPYGLLPDLAGLQQDMAKMGRLQMEGQINDIRQRMTEAGMRNVPTGYSQDLLGNGTTVRNYGATVDDLQSRYEGYVRDNRLRETWGDDYQNVRLGKSQMTVLEFEKRVLDLQQSATDRAYTKGVDAIARGELLVKDGDYARTLGNFIDQQVRVQLRGFAGSEGINDSMASNIWGVNRSIRSDLVEGRGIPDNRLGYNLFADTTLAPKSGSTEQIIKWNAIRPDANYLIIRPSNMPSGGSYVIPRTAIQPYLPSRPPGRGL